MIFWSGKSWKFLESTSNWLFSNHFAIFFCGQSWKIHLLCTTSLICVRLFLSNNSHTLTHFTRTQSQNLHLCWFSVIIFKNSHNCSKKKLKVWKSTVFHNSPANDKNSWAKFLINLSILFRYITTIFSLYYNQLIILSCFIIPIKFSRKIKLFSLLYFDYDSE